VGPGRRSQGSVGAVPTPTTPRPARRRTPAPTTAAERRWWREGARVAGIDEVGRGAWAGQLTVGAVALLPDRRVLGLRDSKQLTPDRRAQLAERLAGVADVGLGRVEVEELDELGLAAALRVAAERAVVALSEPPDVVLIDGTVDLLADGRCSRELLVRGDQRSASIAAASIAAKVARDAAMVAADADHPAYGFARHKGYPTAAHRAALAEHGPCRLHRRSWAPIAALSPPDPAAGREPRGRHV